MKTKFNEFNESVNITIEDNTSYEDFAVAVANTLKNDYGQHNFEPFLTKLKEELNDGPTENQEIVMRLHKQK